MRENVNSNIRLVENTSKIPVKCAQRNKFIPAFMIGVAVLSVISLIYLDIDWLKLASRIPDMGEVFWELAHFDSTNIGQI